MKDEAREKIATALDKFRVDYAAVAERVGNAPPQESYEGVIAEITSSSLRVSSTTGDGSRSFAISIGTAIVIAGVENPSTVDLVLGQTVDVSFVPLGDGSGADPVALAIEVVPSALPPVIADAIEELSEDVVQGEITVVEGQEPSGSTVVIVEEAGSGDTIGVEVTPDTVITVDGESATASDLQADQQVEVIVEEDGVTAGSLVVTTLPPAAAEVTISGVVTAIDPIRRTIVIAPTTGDALRLSVPGTATITLDGVSVSLDNLQPADMVLNTSRYLPGENAVTRLAASRPVTEQPTAPEQSGTEPQATAEPAPQDAGSGGTPGPVPFTIKGFVKSFDGDIIVFDGVTLPKSAGFALPEGVAEGSEVDLVFTIAEDGSVVLTEVLAR